MFAISFNSLNKTLNKNRHGRLRIHPPRGRGSHPEGNRRVRMAGVPCCVTGVPCCMAGVPCCMAAENGRFQPLPPCSLQTPAAGVIYTLGPTLYTLSHTTDLSLRQCPQPNTWLHAANRPCVYHTDDWLADASATSDTFLRLPAGEQKAIWGFLTKVYLSQRDYRQSRKKAAK